MDSRLDEREFARMLRAGLKKAGRVVKEVAKKPVKAVSDAANASYEKGRAEQAQMSDKEQLADAERTDRSRFWSLKGRGPV